MADYYILNSYGCDKSCNTDDLRLILVGKTGTGKSAAGNIILGRKEFTSKPSPGSVTQECWRGRCEFKGRRLAVVDTPGFFDTAQSNLIIIKEITRCAVLGIPGPHAIVVVLQAGRFTKEEGRAVQIIQDLFGKGAEKYMIVLFTRKDDLPGGSLEPFISKTVDKLKELIDVSGGRYLAFNNRATGREKEEQRRELIDMIDRMVAENGGQWYQHPMYQEAEEAFKQKETELVHRFHEEYKDQLRRIGSEKQDKLSQIQNKNNGNISKKQMESVHKQAESKLKEKEKEFKLNLSNVTQIVEEDMLREIEIRFSEAVAAGAREGAATGSAVGASIGAAILGLVGAVLGAVIGGAVGGVAGSVSSVIRHLFKSK